MRMVWKRERQRKHKTWNYMLTHAYLNVCGRVYLIRMDTHTRTQTHTHKCQHTHRLIFRQWIVLIGSGRRSQSWSTGMCPRTTIYVSSCYQICPHNTVRASSYYFICVLILLHQQVHHWELYRGEGLGACVEEVRVHFLCIEQLHPLFSLSCLLSFALSLALARSLAFTSVRTYHYLFVYWHGNVCVFVRVGGWIRVCALCVHIYIYTYMLICMYIYIYVCIYILYVYVYIYIHICTYILYVYIPIIIHSFCLSAPLTLRMYIYIYIVCVYTHNNTLVFSLCPSHLAHVLYRTQTVFGCNGGTARAPDGQA